jgi:hypothetical protein
MDEARRIASNIAKNGVETAGLVLIKVHASRIHYWDGENEGKFAV